MSNVLRQAAFWVLLPVFVIVLSLGPAMAQSVNSANKHADPESLKAGLDVCYMREFIRHIRHMLELEEHKNCLRGPAIEVLNYSVGKGEVLTSGSVDGVMAKITGYIHLETAGFYAFAFESNDGVRLEIDGQMIVEDPDVHADRFSDIGGLQVQEPGWYPLIIRYFERKNTSTLKFYWQVPGSDGTMPIVPASALRHGS